MTRERMLSFSLTCPAQGSPAPSYRSVFGCYNIRPPDIRPQTTQNLSYIRPTWVFSHHVSVLWACWVWASQIRNSFFKK